MMLLVLDSLFMFILITNTFIVRSEPTFDLEFWEDSFHSPYYKNVVHPSRLLSVGTEQALLQLPFMHRSLQQTPESICESYNKLLAGMMKCNCSRALSTDVRVFCQFNGPQCSTSQNGTACFDGSIDSYIDKNTKPFAVTSCFNITTSPTLEKTCVQVFPVAAGNFSSIANCTATLNDKLCNFCRQCGNGTIQIDCCNVVPDKRQKSCSAVSANGGALANFDFVDPKGPNAGKCKGSYGYSGASQIFCFSIVPLLTIIFVMLLQS